MWGEPGPAGLPAAAARGTPSSSGFVPGSSRDELSMRHNGSRAASSSYSSPGAEFGRESLISYFKLILLLNS